MQKTPQALTPVKTTRASEAIYEQIRDLIVSGEFKPGDRLPSERGMMDMLQRSRPTIREALRMLERDGFIRTVHGSQGAIVQQPSTKAVEQNMETLLYTSSITLEALAEMRGVTEVATARWAAQRCTEQDAAILTGLIEQQQACVTDFEAFIHLDPQMHAALGHTAKNDVAVMMTRVFSHLVENLMRERMLNLPPEERVTMCEKILHMHKKIISCIVAHDEEGAAAAMREHVDAFQNDLSV